MKMQIVRTNVKESERVAAQGGYDPSGGAHDYRLWVECPASYDPASITAADICGDNMITVVDEPDNEEV